MSNKADSSTSGTLLVNSTQEAEEVSLIYIKFQDNNDT